jgi:hypothetical protein
VVYRRRVRNICNPAVNSGAGFLRGQLASRRLELPAIVINQAEPRSFARENGGGRATDSPRAAGDQGRTPSQSTRHWVLQRVTQGSLRNIDAAVLGEC